MKQPGSHIFATYPHALAARLDTDVFRNGQKVVRRVTLRWVHDV